MRNFILSPAGVVVLALLIAVAGGAYTISKNKPQILPIVCTADAMQCPDGSYVGRTGPNCEFVCPGSTPNTTPPSGGGSGGILPYNSGILGTVTIGPTCPVMREPADPNCADKPYSTVVVAFRANDPVHPFAITQSDATGAFEFSLPPGDYVVGAGESNLPRCAQTPAAVGPSGYTEVVVWCDTGIR